MTKKNRSHCVAIGIALLILTSFSVPHAHANQPNLTATFTAIPTIYNLATVSTYPIGIWMTYSIANAAGAAAVTTSTYYDNIIYIASNSSGANKIALDDLSSNTAVAAGASYSRMRNVPVPANFWPSDINTIMAGNIYFQVCPDTANKLGATRNCSAWTKVVFLSLTCDESTGAYTSGANVVGRPMNWTANLGIPTVAKGMQGGPPFTFSWSGTDGLSGSRASVTKTYTTAGDKTASVTVTSGGQSLTVPCDGQFYNWSMAAVPSVTGSVLPILAGPDSTTYTPVQSKPGYMLTGSSGCLGTVSQCTNLLGTSLSTLLMQDALVDNQYDCNYFNNCNSGFSTRLAVVFSASNLSAGYLGGIYGESGNNSYTSGTATRLCQLQNPTDSTVVGTASLFSTYGSPGNNNTLRYDAGAGVWDLLRADQPYGGSYGAKYSNTYFQGLTCNSYALPQITLRLSTPSITSGGSATVYASADAESSGANEQCMSTDIPGVSTTFSYFSGGVAKSVSPTQTTTYDFSCKNMNGTTQESVTLTVLGADLTASAITPASAVVGTPLKFSSTITNSGASATSAAFPVLYQSATDASGSNATNIGTQASVAALAGSSATESSTMDSTYTPTASGTIYIRACANTLDNSTFSVTESNYGNNCAAWTPITVTPAAMNGSCGTANGQHYPYGTSSYGSYTQCGNGSPSSTAFPTAGNSTTWTCSGQYGGSASGTCSAAQQAPGVCGTASGKNYPYGSTSYGSDLQCAAGGSTNTAFPAANSSVSWICTGPYGGTNSGTCSAAQQAPGVCGTANGKNYPYGTSSYGSDTQCAAGGSTNTAFPAAGGNVQWICTGPYGGTNSGTCSASQIAAPTVSATINNDPVPYLAAPSITMSSTNSVSCATDIDWSGVGPGAGNWNSFVNGTFSGPTTLSVGVHTLEILCENSTGVYAGGGWQLFSFTVSPAPTDSVSVSPNPVYLNYSPTFTLSSTNTDSCYLMLDNNSSPYFYGGYTTSGTFAGPSNLSAGVHDIASFCYNKGGSAYSGWNHTSFTVSPAPTVTVTVNNDPVPYGAAPSVTYSSTNTGTATNCRIVVDWNDIVTAWTTNSGTYSGPTNLSAGSHTASAWCANPPWAANSGWQTISFTVSPPPTDSVSVSPNPVPLGSSPTFTLSSTNTDSCYLMLDNNSSPYFYGGNTTSGTFAGPTNLSVGVHDIASFCYNKGGSAYSGWNHTSFTVSAPDLTTGATTVTGSLTPSTPISFASTAINQGIGVATNFPNFFQITDSAKTTTLALVTAQTVPTLAGWDGVSSYPSTALSATYPAGLAAGTYYARSCTNNNTSWVNIITESNYGNDCGAWQSFTIGYPAITGPGGVALTCQVSPTTGGTSTTYTWSANGASGGNGGPYTYHWTGTNLTGRTSSSASITVTNYSAGGPYSGSVYVTDAASDTSATTPCSNSAMVVTAPTATLLANGAASATIDSGQSVNLSWTSTGANVNSCFDPATPPLFDNGPDSGGPVAVGPLTSSQNYQITCTGPGGTGSSLVVPVTVLQPTAVIRANPERVASGGSSTVSWSSSQVTSCTVTGPNGFSYSTLSNTGVTVTGITQQSVYTIDCKTQSADKVSTATVNLSGAGTINQF